MGTILVEAGKLGSKLVSGAMLALLLVNTLIVASNFRTVKAESRTWIVDDDGTADFSTIQEAIDAADGGDTIYVHNGTYHENVVINKTVSLLGEAKDGTVIDGATKGTVVYVGADNVTIANFTVLNSSMGNGFFGIAVFHRENVTLIDNNVRNNEIGIIVAYSKNVIVNRNSVSKNYGGIIVNHSENCTVAGNHVWDNSWGISLYGSRDCELQGNAMADNLYNLGINGDSLSDFTNRISASNTVNGKFVYYLVNQSNLTINPSTHPELGYLALINSKEIVAENLNVTQNYSGILLVNASNSRMSYINATRNYAGIALYLSSNIIVEASSVSENTESGIYLGYSENSKIALNNVTDHTTQKWSNGIELYHSRNITATANNVSNNKYGMYLYYSDGNVIHRNNFVENTNQIGVYASHDNVWDAGYPYGGNYWSDYTGGDSYGGPYQNETGGDGIGDVPYAIDASNRDRYPLMKPWKTILGDLNYDGIVDIRDIVLAAEAFGAYLDHPRWNPTCDLNDDGRVDIRDLALTAGNFGKTWRA